MTASPLNPPNHFIAGGRITKDNLLSALAAMSEMMPNSSTTSYNNNDSTKRNIAPCSDERSAEATSRVNSENSISRLGFDKVLHNTANIRDNVQVYICGPPDMIESMEQYLLELGLNKKQIRYEKWW